MVKLNGVMSSVNYFLFSNPILHLNIMKKIIVFFFKLKKMTTLPFFFLLSKSSKKTLLQPSKFIFPHMGPVCYQRQCPDWDSKKRIHHSQSLPPPATTQESPAEKTKNNMKDCSVVFFSHFLVVLIVTKSENKHQVIALSFGAGSS